jgi:hypothetical protein
MKTFNVSYVMHSLDCFLELLYRKYKKIYRMSYKKHHALLSKCLGFFFLTQSYITATHSDEKLQLLMDAQNPLSNTIVFPFRNNFNFGFANQNKLQDLLQTEARLPIKISENVKVVARPILPVVEQFNVETQSGHVFGLGDLNPQFYFAPTDYGIISLGIGPAFAIPTATISQLGTGKVSVGPAVAFAAVKDDWVLGFYANNVWSFAGAADRPSVNLFNLEAFAYYYFSNGWFLTSTPNLTANWYLEGSQKWIVPIGGGIGYIFKLNQQNVIATLQSFYNVAVPPSIATKWSIRFSLYLAFPENKPISLPFITQ